MRMLGNRLQRAHYWFFLVYYLMRRVRLRCMGCQELENARWFHGLGDSKYTRFSATSLALRKKIGKETIQRSVYRLVYKIQFTIMVATSVMYMHTKLHLQVRSYIYPLSYINTFLVSIFRTHSRHYMGNTYVV